MDSPNTLLAKFHQIYQSINKSIKQTFGLQTPRKLPTPAKIKHKVSKKLFKPREKAITLPKTPANTLQTEDQKLKEIERKLNWLIKEKMVEVENVQKSPFTLNPGFDLGLSPTVISSSKRIDDSVDTITTQTNSQDTLPKPEAVRMHIDPLQLQAGKNSLSEAPQTPKIPLDLFQEMKSVKLRPTPLQDRPVRANSMENQLLLDLQSKFKNAEGNEENLLEWSDSESLKGIFE